ncbi:MAG: type I 3-dehydroquinate dehydratase [Candidatus Levyibacteriota bacterium]
MKTKLCLPIIKKTKEEVLQTIEKNKKLFDMFEVWIDYVKDIDNTFTEKLSKKMKGKLIFVFRRKDGKNIHMKFSERKKIFEIVDTNTYVDLDMTKQKEDISFLADKQTNTIISFHDYKKTPSAKKMIELITEMKKHNPEIIKIATFCNERSDAERLMELLDFLQHKKTKSIVIGMGNLGVKTRIDGALRGNTITFVSLDEKDKIAPGQLTRQKFLHEMEKKENYAR